jgi:hypothetical protein
MHEAWKVLDIIFVQAVRMWAELLLLLRVWCEACARGRQEDSRLGCYVCLALLLTVFFCFVSTAPKASDKCDGIDLSTRSH